MRAAFPSAPDEADTEVCEDGTAAHWLASELWEDRTHTEGSLSPNGRVLTDEMFDGVDLYHGVLRAVEWSAGETYCEKPQDCSVIFPGMQGTPDAFTIYRDADGVYHLRIVDFKFGFRFVDAWRNWQLIVYAAAVARNFNLPANTIVELTIVQPRCYTRQGSVRSWHTTLADMQPLVEQLREAAKRAMSPNPQARVNPGCRDCPGRHACVTLQHGALAELDTHDAALPLTLTAEALADEMRRLEYAQDKIKARLSGLKVQAEMAIREGKIVPGYEMAPTFAREGWRDGGDVIIAGLAQLYKANVTTSKTVTPAQARKVMPASIVAMFAHKPSTGVRLQQIDPNEARKKFTPLPHKE